MTLCVAYVMDYYIIIWPLTWIYNKVFGDSNANVDGLSNVKSTASFSAIVIGFCDGQRLH